MKQEKDYTNDISEIRSIMERSSRFMSLSGLGAILAGIYALGGVLIAHQTYGFNPTKISGGIPDSTIIILAAIVLILSVSSVMLLSYRKARANGEKVVWHASSQRLFFNLAIPLAAGGVFVLILFSKDLAGLTPAVTLLFYGVAMFNASKHTYPEVKSMGILLMIIGLLNAYFIELGLLWWAIGFGGINMAYGIYIHFKY